MVSVNTRDAEVRQRQIVSSTKVVSSIALACGSSFEVSRMFAMIQIHFSCAGKTRI